MFAPAQEILKAREGTLAETPFPLLLHALLVEERSCQLELRVRQLEKRILFEDGSPVGCSSNLLHETLGKFLVERGKLTEAQYQKALSDSVTSGDPFSDVLVKQSLIAPFDLYKQMQTNLAHTILDCFRWVDARYRLSSDVDASQSPIRMNSLQLILTGASSFLPFEAVVSNLVVASTQRFGLVPNAPHPISELKLAPKDARLVQLLKARPTFLELRERAGLDTEQAMRRLYGLCVIGVVDFTSEASPSASAPGPAAPPPQLSPPSPAGLPFADDDDGVKNALMTEFLEHRKKDPFGLLGVPVDVLPPALRRAFLAKASRFAPVRFQSVDLREKAEELLLAFARAYGALNDPEQLALHQKRRQSAVQSSPRPSAADQFKIKTELLDASAQFEMGKRRLEAGTFRAAIEYFEYACDIEPKAKHRAYLAWSRYQLNPAALAKLALQELTEACKQEPNCEEAWDFAGQLQHAAGHPAEAQDCFRKAYKLNPDNRRYAELIRDLSRARK